MAVGPTDARVVVAGHICLDLTPALEGPADVRPGGLVRVGPMSVSAGGAVANTGLALHRLGVPVRLMAKVGDDALAATLLDVLRRHDRRLAGGMIVAPGAVTSYSIVVSPPGVDRGFLHCPGANDTFVADDVRYGQLAGAALFHFGYPPLMRAMSCDGGEQLRRMYGRVRGAGLATSLDLAQPDPASEAGRIDWARVLRATLPFVDVVLPSIDELLFMLDRPTYERRAAGAALTDVIDAGALAGLAGSLLEMGAAVVGIKLGEQGFYLRTSADAGRIAAFCRRLGLDAGAWRDGEAFAPCFRADRVVGTTGSGDCAIAGFLAALLRGGGPIEAATAAVAVGACSVEAAGATEGVPSWQQIANRMAAGWARLPVTWPAPAIRAGADPSPGVERDVRR